MPAEAEGHMFESCQGRSFSASWQDYRHTLPDITGFRVIALNHLVIRIHHCLQQTAPCSNFI
jgi:hypothetical protein